LSATAKSRIAIERVTGASDEVRALIAELNAELAQHYLPEQQHGLSLDALFQPHIRFFITRVDGAAAGCGGIALFSDFAELKRMYVKPGRRGQGIADALVEKLTAEALSAGLSLLRLETGTQQTAAMRFYRRCGFTPCVAFEPYASMPPIAIATSAFFEKRVVALPSVERH
jgi:putative acetyltransferase